MCELPIFVSTGTLVPPTPSSILLKPLRLVLSVPHRLGVGPSPDRFLADSAYGPLKKLRTCWVVTLSWLGLANREASLKIAREKLRELLEKYPDCQVILVGTSQGGLIVAELALEPEFVDRIAAVVFAGVPFKGAEVLKKWFLKWATCFPGVAAMEVEHASLLYLGERIANTWPTHISVTVAASPHDELVTVESAFGVRFPRGTAVKWYKVDDCPPHTADDSILYLRGPRRYRHLSLCRGGLVPVIRDLRIELASAVAAAA